MMKTSPVFQKHEKERKPLSLIIFKQLDSQIPINKNVDIPGKHMLSERTKRKRKKTKQDKKHFPPLSTGSRTSCSRGEARFIVASIVF